MDTCLFCRIVAGRVPARVVYHDERCIAFRDISPVAPTHVLVVPRRHIPTLDAASATDRDDLGHLLLTAAEVARQEGIAGDGYRCVLNTNAAAGQTVFHVHVHLIGGRPLSWPPG